jgi:hypothetical protein
MHYCISVSLYHCPCMPPSCGVPHDTLRMTVSNIMSTFAT